VSLPTENLDMSQALERRSVPPNTVWAHPREATDLQR